MIDGNHVLHCEARDIDDVWHQLIFKIEDSRYTHKYLIDSGSYEGQYRHQFNRLVTINITHPWKNMIPRMPPGKEHLAPNNQDMVDDYIVYLMTDEKKDNEAYTYGERLNHLSYKQGKTLKCSKGQIEHIIWRYEQGHGTNQCCMEIGMPQDLRLDDPPCMRLIDTKIIDGRLDFFVYFRSWDLYNALPTNLAGLEMVKQYMSSEIGVKNGSLQAASTGLHVYDHSMKLISERINGA